MTILRITIRPSANNLFKTIFSAIIIVLWFQMTSITETIDANANAK